MKHQSLSFYRHKPGPCSRHDASGRPGDCVAGSRAAFAVALCLLLPDWEEVVVVVIRYSGLDSIDEVADLIDIRCRIIH